MDHTQKHCPTANAVMSATFLTFSWKNVCPYHYGIYHLSLMHVASHYSELQFSCINIMAEEPFLSYFRKQIMKLGTKEKVISLEK